MGNKGMNKTITFADTKSNEPLSIRGSQKVKHERHQSARLLQTSNVFHTLGDGYRPPKHDHKYKIKYAPFLGKWGERPKSNTYMSQVVQKAKKMVDPSKYTHQRDWKKMSLQRPTYIMPREKKVTITERVMQENKRKPAPTAYQDINARPKIHGFYDQKDLKASIFESINEEKKHIPCSNKYESRGKSMY